MVRGLGVSHKSLFVPGVTEGTYAIRFEHADYFTKDFNISVGAGLPTTFTEGMTEKAYSMLLEFPSTNLLTHASIIEGDNIAFNDFYIRNSGNTNAYAWYTIAGAGLGIESINTHLLTPGEAITVSVPDQATTASVGAHNINLNVGPSTTTSWEDVLSTSDNRTETLTIIEWATDVTFIATAPGISDLHGVEVFIDGTSMGTT